MRIPAPKYIPKNFLLGLFILSAIISLFALRHNNLTMVKLRDAVYAADKNNSDINAALNNLRSYVYSHMNTNLGTGTNVKPPIQLKYTYERLQAAEQAKVEAANSSLYTEAQNYCQAQNPTGFSGGVRVPCVTGYIENHGGTLAKDIPVSLYQFDFVSPKWSPDFAGWSTVVSFLLLLAYLFAAGAERVMHWHNRDL